jgi:hypothetical protein
MKQEGFWFSVSSPDYPVPKPSHMKWIKQEEFVTALRRKEAQALKTTYRGFSTCRICFSTNGSAEFKLEDWCWPSGFIHYIENHNVKPSQEFIDFVLDKSTD